MHAYIFRSFRYSTKHASKLTTGEILTQNIWVVSYTYNSYLDPNCNPNLNNTLLAFDIKA